MKIDIFKYADKIPSDFLKRKVLDNVLNIAIPFNFSLGLHIKSLGAHRVEVTSHNGWKTRNHVGGAHACFLALLGEYPAGLLLAQNYSPEIYRIMIGELNVEYHKQGRGFIKAVARKPEPWPDMEDSEIWVPMVTDLFDKNGESLATVRTRWQIKEWHSVRSPQK